MQTFSFLIVALYFMNFAADNMKMIYTANNPTIFIIEKFMCNTFVLDAHNIG